MKAYMDGLCVVIMLLSVAIITGGCTTLDDLRSERDDLRRENTELRDELQGAQAILDASLASNRQLEQNITNLQTGASTQLPTLRAVGTNTGFAGIENVEQINDGRRITLRIPGDVLFDSGKVSLKSTARRMLDQIARVIKSDYPGNTVYVNGFTDTDPIQRSKWKDNLELSLHRAASVHRRLQSQGVDPRQIVAAGLGQWHPRDTKPHSRRVEIVVELGSGALTSVD